MLIESPKIFHWKPEKKQSGCGLADLNIAVGHRTSTNGKEVLTNGKCIAYDILSDGYFDNLKKFQPKFLFFFNNS